MPGHETGVAVDGGVEGVEGVVGGLGVGAGQANSRTDERQTAEHLISRFNCDFINVILVFPENIALIALWH